MPVTVTTSGIKDSTLRFRGHDARFRLLSAQEKTLASCGSQGLFGRMG